ncbi:MAG TPA: PKD domain-containing protein, partial [Thermoplasmata archaeon]|nr:PKD domain-containing protein [Thermoplasmata archaeon]
MQQVDPPRPGMRGRVATVAVIAVMVLSGIALVGAALIHPGAAVAPPKEASGLPASPSAASHASPYVASGAVSPLTFTPSWWQLPKVPAQLSSRCCVAFAYDPVWGGDILFGGNTGAAQKDTWLFNNSQWTSLTSSLSTAPSARWGAVMVWDAYDNYLVLFGGRSPTSFFSDTWIFNATGWHALTPSSAPSARAFTQAFYDPTLHEVVLFGGSNEVSTKPVTWADYGDTWTFQSGTWTNITSSLSVSPPKTASAYMDWDPTDSVGIMFGGTATSAGCANYNTTWAFGSSGWTNITSAVTGDPGYYENGAGVWDGIDHYLVAFGGIEPTGSGTTCTKPMAESWEYTTDVWTNQTAAMGSNIPKARSSMEMTYDPLLKTVIMFGGDTTGKGNFVNEVWSYPVAPIVPTITVVNTVIPINTAINYNLTMTGGAGPFTFTWTFDDGSSSVATENTTHTFTNLGTYTVNVEIQDAQSRYANATVQMTVVAHLSAAATTSSVAGEKPFKVTF